MDHLLAEVIKRAKRYLAELPGRRVSPLQDAVDGLRRLDVPLQDHPLESSTVLAELDDIGSDAGSSTCATASTSIRTVARF